MKIAHIVCAYPPYFSGMGNAVFQTAQQLIALGHEVTVFTAAKQPAAEREKEISHVKEIAPTLSYGNAAYLPEIQEELDEFDIVHLHYPFFGTANLVRRWKLRHNDRPLVITYHMDAHADGWKGLMFSLYARYWMPKILGVADMLIASSFDFLKSSDAKKIYEQVPQKWVELPFGVDMDRFQKISREKRGKKIVLFVGGMDEAHHFKGIPVLLRAMVLLKKQNSAPQLVLVGDGTLRERYELQAKGMGLKDCVKFVGRVSDEELPSYYQQADLLVLPSTSSAEAFGIVLLEAMACGTPVLSSDLPGVRNVAKDGGAVFPVRDYVSLAQQMMTMCARSDAEQERISQEIRAHVEKAYSWPAIAARLEQIYKNLARG